MNKAERARPASAASGSRSASSRSLALVVGCVAIVLVEVSRQINLIFGKVSIVCSKKTKKCSRTFSVKRIVSVLYAFRIMRH